MNVSEYITEFITEKNIHHIFGYQGTMIAYIIDAIGKNSEIQNHSCYNEQGAAFAACGYSKATGNLSVAYATSGPGALNLVSGIADAYYDSMPVLFITGQLNTTEYTNIPQLRQQGFQQTDIVSIVSSITKYAVKIDTVDQVSLELEKAIYIATHGRKGPVLLDIPMNIQKATMPNKIKHYSPKEGKFNNEIKEKEVADFILSSIKESKRPVFLFGNGISKSEEMRSAIKKLVDKYKVPIITSLLGKDLIGEDNYYNCGIVGAAYGHRCANIIMYEKTDLIISLGSSMCRRQTGGNTEKFAEKAKIIRVDIDDTELKRKVHKSEHSFVCDVNKVISCLIDNKDSVVEFDEWAAICKKIKELTYSYENHCITREPNKYIEVISELAPSDLVVVSDVGQHQMWTAQSFFVKGKQKVIFSGGHGAMGFALPAAIGAYYATNKKVVCIAGDGAFQMNIQELQWIVRENIPITIFVLNNNCLGLIQQQQDDFFGGRHIGSTKGGGYTSPNFSSIASAYEIKSCTVKNIEELYNAIDLIGFKGYPALIEILINDKSKAHPKTYFGEAMNNQRPYLDEKILEQIKKM